MLYFRAIVGSGRFVTLVAVKTTGDKLGYAPAEWIWSDLFSWMRYEGASERCLNWYERQPHPSVYTGKKKSLKVDLKEKAYFGIEVASLLVEGFTTVQP